MPKHPLSDSRPMTAKELAEYMSVTTRTIHAWKASGKIPHIKLGSRIRYYLDDVQSALTAK